MNIAERKANLAKLITELEAGQAKMEAGTPLTAAEGADLDAKAKEAVAHQAEIEKYESLAGVIQKSREIDETFLPGNAAKHAAASAANAAKAGRGAGIGADGSAIVGYMTLGDAFVASPEFKRYVESGMGREASVNFRFDGSLNEPVIPVTQKMIEQKAVPTFTGAVVQADRIGLVQQLTQYDRLRVRDVLNQSQTDSNSVEYVTENAVTAAATPVAEGAAKPEATMTLAIATSPVRTLAVWMPVTEQQLADLPQVRNIIDNRLMYDLKKLEESQFMYGSGAGQNLAGILPLAGVPLITRTVTNTQNLDRIRIGITDVLIAGYEPNALCVHPLDWEAIVLLKNADNNYLWTIATDAATGRQRVFGLDVVETVAMKAPTTTQRYLLVGDFRRGATVWDRQAANVAVGYIANQFIENVRTIRVEERLAFGVHAPTAFAKYETAVAA